MKKSHAELAQKTKTGSKLTKKIEEGARIHLKLSIKIQKLHQ